MRRVIYEVSPDRRVIYEFASDARSVETDQWGRLPEQFVMRVEDVDQHALEIDARVVDARPVIERVSVVRNPDAGWIEASDLARINLTELFDLISGDTQIIDHDLGATGYIGVMPASGMGAAAVAGLRRKRSEITPARLREVAVAYDELWSDELSKTDAIEAVARALVKSTSQTYRLIARAKAEVDPRTGKPYIPPSKESER